MAIQFRCAGCSQPIEVDDEFAGKDATCPYCRRVITVPLESALHTEATPAARPAAGESTPPPLPTAPLQPTGEYETPDELHVGPRPLTHRESTARSWGSYALICAALGILMILATAAYSAWLGWQMGLANPESQPSKEQMQAFQQQLESIPWLAPAELGGVFLCVVGLCLGIVSLSQSARGNWRGWISVVLCGGLLLCVCSVLILSVAGGAPF